MVEDIRNGKDIRKGTHLSSLHNPSQKEEFDNWQHFLAEHDYRGGSKNSVFFKRKLFKSRGNQIHQAELRRGFSTR